MGRIQEYSMLNCAVNPQACRERVTAYNPVTKPKKVLIIGGGVAGCEAARVLATRGHRPELFEKGHALGGNLIPGGAPDFKEDDRKLAQWYTDELKRLQVPVTLEHTVTKAEVLAGDYDTVLVATGSMPKVFSLGDDERVFPAADVLTGARSCGEKTAVIGGGLVGCETALWLAEQGKQVVLLEQLDRLLALNGPLCHANSEMLERLVPYRGVSVVTSAKVTGFSDGKLSYEQGCETHTVSVDSVILSVGYKEENSLYHELEFEVPEIYLLGDARKVQNIMYAIWDAFEVANHI